MRLKSLITFVILSMTMLSIILAETRFGVLVSPVAAQEAQSSSRFWAVVIEGWDDVTDDDADYMYDTLNEHYDFDEIYYLSRHTSDPRVNNESTKTNIRWAINTWLPSKSNSNDTIMIFYIGHGGGYQEHGYGDYDAGLSGGRLDWDEPDEGNEHLESNVELHMMYGQKCTVKMYPELVDADEDGDQDDYFKSSKISPTINLFIDSPIGGGDSYWIYDVFAVLKDLDGDGSADDKLINMYNDSYCDVDLNYDENNPQSDGVDSNNDGIIVGIDFNENGNYDDYVGFDECLLSKLVEPYWDDEIKSDLNTLEGKYKTLIFMTESCYSGGLIDDLSQENSDRIIMTAANETSFAKKDMPPSDGFAEWSGPFINALNGAAGADSNPEDGHVSMKEAWDYAWTYDHARLHGLETPWLDDDGNGLPTYANGTYVPDLDDGDLAAATWFPKKCFLTVETYDLEETELSGAKIWINGDQTDERSPTTVKIREGNYTVKVASWFFAGFPPHYYEFRHWENNSTNNERYLGYVDSNTTVMAYYEHEQLPPGGCPFIYTWNGQEYKIDNNLLPNSEWCSESDVEDYYKLEQGPVPKYEGLWLSWYSLQIREFEQEHSYFDQVRMLALDHDSSVHIAITPTGEILTFRDPSPPISVVDDKGSDVLDLLQEVDGNYYEGHTDDYLILDFGNLDAEENAKLVMKADGEKTPYSIHVQVQFDDGSWNTVATVHPRVYWATEIVDLSDYLTSINGDLRIKLYFTANHKIDYIGLDTSEQADFVVRNGGLVSAIHSEEGSVLFELLFKDDWCAELVPSQQITLTFILPKQRSEARTFVVYTKGHYFTI